MSETRRAVRSALLRRLPYPWWGPVFSMLNRAASHRRAFRRMRVGAGSYIDPSVQIVGWEHVRVGSNSTLSEGVWLNVNHRDQPVDRIMVGDFCHIGRNNFLSSGPSIELRDYCFTGLDCHFLGCGHDVALPSSPYIVAGLSAGAPIVIGTNCWLATSVTVLEGVEIGRGSVVGARSLVTRSLPPFSIALGAPAQVVKRFDFRNQRWTDMRTWSDDLERFMPSAEEYDDELRRRFSDFRLSLHSGSRRFGWL